MSVIHSYIHEGEKCKLAQLFWKGTLAISYLHFDPAIPLLEIDPEDLLRAVQECMWTKVFIAALFINHEIVTMKWHMYKRTRKPDTLIWSDF